MAKQDVLWIAIRVIGVYVLAQAVIDAPAVFGWPAVVRVLVGAGVGVYLIRGGTLLFEMARAESGVEKSSAAP
jgi:hypothetical protein